MEDHSLENHQLIIRIESSEPAVAPGGSVTIPLFLQNPGASEGSFALSVGGIPSNWVSVPSPLVHLAAGEEREVLITVRPPPPPQGRAGRHHLVIRIANQRMPQQAAEATCTLTVAALAVPGRIGILLPATDFSVAPSQAITIPFVLLNQGLEGDVVRLWVEGIPSSWVYASSASTPLSPGQQQEVALTIQPPRSVASGAGLHPFKILAASQAAPGQVTAADCTLAIATFSQFSCELRPQRIEAGEPARVTVENRGNIQQAFTLNWQGPDGGLDFEPAPAQELRVPPGNVAMAEFRAVPQSRPLFGRERVLPFTTRVRAASGETHNLTGDVIAKPLLPSWVLPAVLVVILAIACISVLFVVLGGLGEGAPPEAPAATSTPDQGQPAPTDLPAEVPTEAPSPEDPTEQPPVEPPQEEQPTDEPAPTEPDAAVPRSDA